MIETVMVLTDEKYAETAGVGDAVDDVAWCIPKWHKLSDIPTLPGHQAVQGIEPRP